MAQQTRIKLIYATLKLTAGGLTPVTTDFVGYSKGDAIVIPKHLNNIEKTKTINHDQLGIIKDVRSDSKVSLNNVRIQVYTWTLPEYLMETMKYLKRKAEMLLDKYEEDLSAMRKLLNPTEIAIKLKVEKGESEPTKRIE